MLSYSLRMRSSHSPAGFQPIFGIAWVLVGVMSVCGARLGAAYRYKDSSGQWVYTDRPPPPGQASQSVALGAAVERR